LGNNVFLTQSFPNDKKKFIKHIHKTFSSQENNSQQKFINETLPNNINSNAINDEYFLRMVNICNELESQRFKPYPVIYNYLKSVYSHSKYVNNIEKYTKWEDVLKLHFERKYKKDVNAFIIFSNYFFKYQLIHTTDKRKWFCKAGSYSFRFKKEAIIEFSKIDLSCHYTKNLSGRNSYDSIVVKNTKGTYYTKSAVWKGSGGVINWEKVGVPEKSTKAELKNYIVSTKSSKLVADSAKLYMPYFKEPVYGKIIDKADLFLRDIDRVYPTFSTYEKRIFISNIFKGIDYSGGFLIKGKTLAGSGDKDNLAKVFIKKNKNNFITAKSIYFDINNAGISSKKCLIKIQIDRDSITHNGLDFNYNKKLNGVELSRPDKGLGVTPFQNFYHMLDMYPSRITYKIGSEELKMTYPYRCSEELKTAKFESKNYFDKNLFNRFKGYDRVNPLIKISNIVNNYNANKFKEGDIASLLNKTIDQAKPLMIEMATYGFIDYDTKYGKIKINKKLIDYVNFSLNISDYDEITFKSDLIPKKHPTISEAEINDSVKLKSYKKKKAQIEIRNRLKNFAIIDLASFELKINGVDEVTISKTNQCWIFPEQASVTILKNREIEFNGWVVAGKMETKTLVSNFSYKENKITLDNCLFSFLRVNPLNAEHGKNKIAMKSDIMGVTGEIFISDVKNRSGKFMDKNDYPKIVIPNTSYVYYNRIHKGAYDTSRFYYSINPFTLDSLTSFDEKELRLTGEFVSAGIFPKIKQQLKIMNDYSFGFIIDSPQDGYPFYGTDAKYNNKIALSNNGLQGSGTINFCKSTSKSNIFTFFPDSTIGYALFTNKPHDIGIEFPDVECQKAFISFLPKKELIKVKSTYKMPLKFFDNEAQLFGSIEISKKGMTGKGDFGFKTAFMNSNNYSFSRWNINADTSSFNLKNTYGTEGDDPLALSATGLRAHISFKERLGKFNSDQEQEIKFPSNLYYCLMDKFIWEMDGSTVNMEKENEKTSFVSESLGEKSNFYSYHPDQEKLNFKALEAQYDLKTQKIFCKKINFIPVGDVKIYPNQQKLTIQKKAVIEQLENAKIRTLSETHNFANCKLNISSKSAYNGDGLYQYYDSDSIVTSVKMNDITCVNSNTKASGKIDEKNRFKLSKHFEYFGNISVISTNPGIFCDGSTRLIHSCKSFSKNWMSFKDTIIADNVIIPFNKNSVNINGEKISAGFVWRESSSIDSIKIYPTFLSKIEKENDPVVFTSYGYILYNEKRNEFQISSKKALNDRSNSSLNMLAVSTHNFISLHTKSCSLNGEGEISLGMDYGPIKATSYGNIDYNQHSKKTSFNLSLRMDIPIDKKIMESLANRIKLENQFRLMSLKKSNFNRAMIHWAGEKVTNKIIESFIEDSKAPKFPNEFENTLFFSGLKLISFNRKGKEEKGLQTNSANVQLISIYEKPIMKDIPLRLFMEQLFVEKSGDKLGIEFMLPNDKKYFFHYEMEKKNGQMLIQTTDSNFKQSIDELKSDKRKDKNFKYKSTDDKIYFSLFDNLFK